MESKQNNQRIAKNTLFLYFRMLQTLIIGLYTSRVILATLGISDYGLYNVVGGVVTMFAFLNGTLSTSTQRFLNFEMGKGNEQKVKMVFSTALRLHTMLTGLVLLLAETVGLWFVLNKLVIAPDRMIAAFWVYQFSIIVVCIQIFQLPFMSTIIAHEKMSAYAYLSIYETLMKLVIVFILKWIDADKLILYAFLYMCVQVSVAYIYNLYCRRQFVEARISFKSDPAIFKEMLGFGGWNVIGSMATMCSGQGINVIFNIFFGTVVNAARGVAYQVSGIISQFANNFQLAVKPQIIKYYAAGQYEEMQKLVFNTSKYSALLLLFLSCPVAVEIDFLLSVWLGKYPEAAPLFIRLILLQSVVTSMSFSVIMVVHATGKLKNVGITAGGANLLVLPISYVLFKTGLGAASALYVCVVFAALETFIELFWMRFYIGFPMLKFYKQVYLTVIPLGIVMFLVPYCIHVFLPVNSDLFRFLVVCVISFLTSSLVLYKWGLSHHQRAVLFKKIKTKIKK